MRLGILCFAVVFASSAALAQEGKIIVKNPDGTTSELVLPEYSTQPVEPRKPVITPQKPKVHVFTAPDKPSVIEQAAPTGKQAIEAPAPPKPEVKKATIAKPPVPKRPAAASNIPPKPESPGRVVSQPQPLEIEDGQLITEKLAKRIALRIAPPARDIDVMPRMYEGQPAYLVRFKTEEGLFDVLVDMVTGDILATKKGDGA
ncbi:MAG: PepSY domain-containing protein [Pseudomonadota bacterium]